MSEIEEEKKAKKGIIDYISSVDFFSTETSFGFEGEDSFKTMCGGFISMLIMIICFIVIVTDESYYSTDIQLAEVLDQTPYTMDSDVFTMGIRVINQTSGQSVVLEGNWTVQFSCDDLDASQTLTNRVVLPYTTDCILGDYCLSDVGTCNAYQQASGPSRVLTVSINFCDFSNISICDYNAIQTAFGMMASDTFQTQLMVSRLRPLNTQQGWISSTTGTNSWFCSDLNVQGDTTIRRDEFSTNTRFLGALGISGNTLIYYNTLDLTPLDPLVYYNPSPTPNQTVFEYSFVPDIRINQYTQQFTDISGILSSYFAFSGVILVLYGILFSHYAENMLHISLGQHLHYIAGPDQKPINFSETNIKTIVTCIIYFHSLSRFYPSCIRPQILMIEAGRKKLDLNNMLGDLIQINVNDTGKNPLIRLRIEEEEEQYQDQQKEEELDAYLSDFLRTSIHESILSIKDIQIFIQWVKLNHYTLEEAMEIALRIFTKQTISNDVFAQNEYREYQSFKQSMKEGECDELYLIVSDKQDSQISINYYKDITIKGEKSPELPVSLHLNGRAMGRRSTKKLDPLPMRNLGDSDVKHLKDLQSP